jgi:hypothetical protein
VPADGRRTPQAASPTARVLEAVRVGPATTRIAAGFVDRLEGADGTHLVVRDLESWSARVVGAGRTFAELGAPRARNG